MKLKRFTASDTRSAMQKIKAAFGPDAVILSSNSVENGVEVVAAIDFDATILESEIASATAEPSSAQSTAASNSPLEEMRQELGTLRSLMETQMRGYFASGAPLHTTIAQSLIHVGVNPNTAQCLVDGINPSLSLDAAWKRTLQNISEKLNIRDSHRIEEGGIYAFVGATGVGKTTTLAKIAARFVLRHGAESLGLVTMDTYRIAAQEQLMMYGKIFGVNVSVAQDQASLARVIRQLSNKKLILIDTAGMNPNDARVIEQMELLGKTMRVIQNVLVLPATSHYEVLKESIKQYGAPNIEQCIITKLDESKALGGVISAMLETGIGASYLTHGQRVPEDIKLATRHQLIEQFAAQAKSIEASPSTAAGSA